MYVAEHHTVEELERLFKTQTDAKVARWIWIVWQARVGKTQPEISRQIGLCRRTVQNQVRRYNQSGMQGLHNRPRAGRRPILTPLEQQQLREKVESTPGDDEVCSLRGVDFQRFIQTEFSKTMSLSGVYQLLHRLDYSWLVPRSRHRHSDPEAIAEFKEKLPEKLAEIQRQHPDRKLTIFFQDECRFGQQGTLTRMWARRGSRPTAVRQTEYSDLWVVGAVSPQSGQAEAILSPVLNTSIINQFLDQFSRSLPAGEHAVMIWDGAGFHRGGQLHVPDNVSVIQLPPYSPELNPIENLWHYFRSHHWSNRVYTDYDHLFDVAESTWLEHSLDTQLIRSVCAAPYIDSALTY